MGPPRRLDLVLRVNLSSRISHAIPPEAVYTQIPSARIWVAIRLFAMAIMYKLYSGPATQPDLVDD
jgi:hypothetical protein